VLRATATSRSDRRRDLRRDQFEPIHRAQRESLHWGGYGDTGFPLTTGARFNPATGTWTALPTEGAPSFREFASVTWTGTNLVVWGGTFGITALADGARWNAASNTWVPMPTAGAPTPRLKHSATWTGSELIVWGGTTGNVDIPGGARWNEASSISSQERARLAERVECLRLARLARAASESKVGRNDPCPCGSGKKHKRCCLSR
jgi:hypothetical protein